VGSFLDKIGQLISKCFGIHSFCSHHKRLTNQEFKPFDRPNSFPDSIGWDFHKYGWKGKYSCNNQSEAGISSKTPVTEKFLLPKLITEQNVFPSGSIFVPRRTLSGSVLATPDYGVFAFNYSQQISPCQLEKKKSLLKKVPSTKLISFPLNTSSVSGMGYQPPAM